MKGYFTLAYDYYTEEISFGKLGVDNGLLGCMRDCLNSKSRICGLIAHDVVEHSVAHRTASYVTCESELRALGAVAFVRGDIGFDPAQEIEGQMYYFNRPIKPVPITIGKFLLDEGWISTGVMKHLMNSSEHERVPRNCIRNAVYQHAWGNWQKSEQFDLDNYRARNVFSFIEDNVDAVIAAISHEERWCTGASVFFDTFNHIFRWQMKRI